MNPYRQQPEKASWSKSISGISPFDISDIYEKKFSISANDKVVTAGSCFAQHLARHLSASGFKYRDYEPAPKFFPADQFNAYNYGVYSARYCNIYTARQLLQTFQRAFAKRGAIDRAWAHKSGFVDPFRPVVEPKPYVSMEEFDAAQTVHYRAIRRVLKESDLFVFTMGLTEGWVDRRDGSVYPLCPGTVAGEYSADLYEFKNFKHAEILSDMAEFILFAKEINPNLKMLLTVSPVALKMTATKDHVLVANTHSKATLRSVAAELSASADFVDYFPSFEIISSHPMRSMFFEPDMREVNPAGVKFVMSHFSRQHSVAVAPSIASIASDEEHRDIVCEEMLLEQAAQ